MAHELDDLFLETWRSFIKSHALLIDMIDRELVAADRIPLHWYDVLIELCYAPDHRLRMHELARSVVLSRSGLTRLVDRLEKAELLTREPDPDDRRGSYAVLTDKGLSALREAWPVYAAGIQQHFVKHMTPQEAQILQDVLARIVKSTHDE